MIRTTSATLDRLHGSLRCATGLSRFALSACWVSVSLLTGCAADRGLRVPDVGRAVRNDLQPIAAPAPVLVPTRISDALAEPAPPAVPLPPEPKLDLLVNNAQAREVFLAIVADTRYSMLMHPNVAGTLSVTLRGVTVLEALEAIRDVYGFDFKIDGRRITVYAPTIQTRIFTVNYPQSQRTGNSELRVSSGAVAQSGSSGGAASGGGATPSAGSSSQAEGSRVTTTSKTDFWAELAGAVRGLVGSGEGRSVITSPQAGIMAVRAMPEELQQVDKFLKAAQIAVERQVMLEAKVVEVELLDGYQSGIDWSALKNGGGATGALGVIGGSTGANALVSGVQANLPGFSASATSLTNGVSLPSGGSGLFGLALAREGFQAVLGFLETQGDVQILSSPRIATLNNQKAVLKVGSEDFFVTNVSSGTTTTATTGSTTPTLPSLTLTPFFSGISLDVTPQIDGGNNIMLHVHPSVTTVTEKTKQIDLGSVGNFRLPLASSNVNETDTLVRVQDGNIVAIGGLMQIESNRSASGLPGSTSSPFFGTLLGNRSNSGRKKEVVVLIKPTIIRTAQDWEAQTQRSRAALDDMEAARARVIRIEGPAPETRPPVK